MKIISAKEIQKHVPLSGLIDEIAKAYLLLDRSKSVMPVRTISDLGAENPLVFFKPVIEKENGLLAIKLLNQLKKTSLAGYPTIQGLVVLIDSHKNEILSIIEGKTLTAYRTGAASGLATKWLSSKDASVLVVFGAGAQSYTQIQAVLAVRNITKVIVFDLYEEAVNKLIAYFNAICDVEFVKGKNLDQIKEGDIICTVTNSTRPLFGVEHLKEGVHINAIGSFAVQMREMPDDVYENAYLYVDHKESCFQESGDIIIPLSKHLINEINYKGELRELLLGLIPKRDKETRRTIFKSTGVATQDLVAADYIYNLSKIHGFGCEIDF